MAHAEIIFEKAGTKVIATRHSYERFMRRTSKATGDQFCERLVDAYRAARSFFDNQPYNSEYFFFNREMKQGAIVAVRRDMRDRTCRDLHLVLVTWYPKGKSRPVHPDTDIITI